MEGTPSGVGPSTSSPSEPDRWTTAVVATGSHQGGHAGHLVVRGGDEQEVDAGGGAGQPS